MEIYYNIIHYKNEGIQTKDRAAAVQGYTPKPRDDACRIQPRTHSTLLLDTSFVKGSAGPESPAGLPESSLNKDFKTRLTRQRRAATKHLPMLLKKDFFLTPFDYKKNSKEVENFYLSI